MRRAFSEASHPITSGHLRLRARYACRTRVFQYLGAPWKGGGGLGRYRVMVPYALLTRLVEVLQIITTSSAGRRMNAFLTCQEVDALSPLVTFSLSNSSGSHQVQKTFQCGDGKGQ